MSRFLIVAIVLLYIASPIDIIPDIPVIGWGDDLVAGLIGLSALVAKPKQPGLLPRP